MKKTIFTLCVLSAALFAVSPAVSASDEGAAYVADEPGTEAAVPTAAAPKDGELKGKTMTEFVNEAKYGKKRKFTDDDAVTLMRASRLLKEQDQRELGAKVERIAAKIANE